MQVKEHVFGETLVLLLAWEPQACESLLLTDLVFPHLTLESCEPPAPASASSRQAASSLLPSLPWGRGGRDRLGGLGSPFWEEALPWTRQVLSIRREAENRTLGWCQQPRAPLNLPQNCRCHPQKWDIGPACHRGPSLRHGPRGRAGLARGRRAGSRALSCQVHPRGLPTSGPAPRRGSRRWQLLGNADQMQPLPWTGSAAFLLRGLGDI